MAEVLTPSQSAIDDVLFQIEEQQRIFEQNYGNAVEIVRRALVHEVAVATATGFVLGSLVGMLAGLWRRRR